MTVLDVANVTFGYTEVDVLENVSLTLDDGEFLGLVGPNGSGKSTLLSIALGLRRPDSGTATLFGEPAHAFDDGHRIGFVGQGVASNDRSVPITVEEIVRLGRFPHAGFGRFGPADHEAVDRAMETTGVAELADRRIQSLSGGQRQRAFIARALAGEADLLALDEPTVGVDAESREEFYSLLNGLSADGVAILLIEHDIGVVTEHADTVACVNCTLHYHGDPGGFDADVLADAYGTAHQVVHHDHYPDHA